METWIMSALAPIVVSIVAWILNKSSRKLAEFEKIIKLHQEEISRLSVKLSKMEAKLELKDDHLEQKRIIINEAFRCKKPSSQCPVLIMQAQFYARKNNEKFTTNSNNTITDNELQSENISDSDQQDGGDNSNAEDY